MKKIAWKRRIPIIVYGFLGFSGLILAVIDFSTDFLPDNLQLLLTVFSTLSSFMALLESTLQKKYVEMASGFEKAEILSILKLYGINLKQEEGKETSIICSREKAICDLIYLTAQSLHGLPGYKINNQTAYESDYYVYTRASALVDSLKEIMTQYMCVLINSIMDNVESNSGLNETNLFFLIVPAGSNVILADSVSKRMKIPLLISQVGGIDRDSEPAKTEREIPYEYFYRQFHGMDSLILAVQNSIFLQDIGKHTIILHGIVIDCNVTSGSIYKKTVMQYNHYIDEYGDRLNQIINEKVVRGKYLNNGCVIELKRIDSSAALFAAHLMAHETLISNLKECGLNLYCYFVLTEEAKEYINENKTAINDSGNVLGSDQNNIVVEAAKKCLFKHQCQIDETVDSLVVSLPKEDRLLFGREGE